MLLQICVCVCAVLAIKGGAAYPSHPPPLYLPPHPYHPPAPHHPDVPPKYDYTYGVNDDYQKLMFDQTESRDGHKTTGSYSVRLPDGRKQTVTYSDHGNGLEAEVTYEGEVVVDAYPVHPPPPPTYPRQPYFPVYDPVPIYSAHPAPSADLEAVTVGHLALLEEDANPGPVQIVEAPTDDEAPAEEAKEEAAASAEETNPAEEETVTSPLEEDEEEEIVEDTTLTPEA